MGVSNESAQEPLHVAILSFGLDGGMAHYSAMLTNALADFVEVTVITPRSEETASLFRDDITVRTVDVDASGNSNLGSAWQNLTAFVGIQHHLYNADPDIVHVPFIAGLPSTAATLVACMHQSPVIGTVHDPVSHVGQEVSLFGMDLRERLVTFTTRYLDTIIVHGTACREQARALGYPMERVRVLPHGLYTHFETEETAREPAEHTLLFFGKIRPNKGFDRIPEIVDRVAEEVPDVRAIVAGSPDVAPQIDDDVIERTLEELASHPRVELHDRYIPNDEVPGLFQEASVVVLPYYDATASGVAMIAYTFGTPLVATRTGDLGHMIERDETGLLADPHSTAEIAAQTTTLLTDEALQQACRENIQAVRGNYSWEKIARETVSLYRVQL